MNQQAIQNLTNRAIQCVEAKKYELAISLLKNVLSAAPKHIKARKYLRIAQIMAFKSKRYGKAAVWIREIKALPQKLRAAKFLKEPQKGVDAVNAVEDLLEANPFNPVYVDMAVTAANNANMPELAALTVEIVCENSPAGDVRLLEKAATYYKLAKQWTKARDVYRKILVYSPTDQRIVQLLKNAEAQCTIADGWEQNAGRQGATRDLLKDRAQTERLDKQNAANLASGDVDSVAKIYIDRIAQNTNDVNSYRALARTYLKAKRFDEAVSTLEKALAVSSADPELDNMLSNAKLAAFDMLIEERKKRGEDYVSVQAERDLFELDDLTERVERYPNDAHLRYLLGNLMVKNNRYEDAIRHLQISQKSPKDRLESLYLLAKCFIAKGQTDLGVMQLETASSQIPTMTELKKKIVYQLGLCAEDAGDDEKAYMYYRDIYAADIGFADLNERMMVLDKAIKKRKAESNR